MANNIGSSSGSNSQLGGSVSGNEESSRAGQELSTDEEIVEVIKDAFELNHSDHDDPVTPSIHFSARVLQSLRKGSNRGGVQKTPFGVLEKLKEPLQLEGGGLPTHRCGPIYGIEKDVLAAGKKLEELYVKSPKIYQWMMKNGLDRTAIVAIDSSQVLKAKDAAGHWGPTNKATPCNLTSSLPTMNIARLSLANS